MPRLSVTFPKDLCAKITAIAGDNDESISYTIAKMTELGLMVTENQKKNKNKKSMQDVEEHCYKLIIQMNAIIKSIAAKKLDYTKDNFDKFKDAAVARFNDLAGLVPEEL